MAMTEGTSRLVYTGYCNGQATKPISVYVYYKTSENITTNVSTVYVGMYVTVVSGWDIGPWTDNSGSYVGTSSLTFSGSIPNFSGTRWLVENKSFTVTHNDDGTGSTTIYWKWGVNSSWGKIQNISGNFDITLPTIARASQPSCITCPNTTVDVGNIGGSFYIYMNRHSDSFTHTVTCWWGNKVIVVGTNVTSNCLFTIPMDFCEELANITQGWGTIKVDTYNGSTLIGSKIVQFTAHVPAYDLTPAVGTISLVNNNQTINGWNVIINTFTKIQWSITPPASQYNNSISEYHICLIPDSEDLTTADSIYDIACSSSSSGTSEVINHSGGTYRLKTRIKDSRDKWSDWVFRDPNDSTKPLKITIYDYAAPKIQGAVAFRCDQTGTAKDDGTYVSLNCAGLIGASVGNRNTVSVTYQVKEVDDESFSAAASITSSPISGFLVAKSYDILFSISDTIGTTVTRSVKVPVGKTDFNLQKNKAAFGKYAEEDDTLAVAWNARIDKVLYADGGIVGPNDVLNLNITARVGEQSTIPAYTNLNAVDEYLRLTVKGQMVMIDVGGVVFSTVGIKKLFLVGLPKMATRPVATLFCDDLADTSRICCYGENHTSQENGAIYGQVFAHMPNTTSRYFGQIVYFTDTP